MSAAPSADAPPREVAAYLLSLLRKLGLDGVLVGTTAALATRDIDVRSKDTDVVAIGARSAASLKKALREIARRDGLEFVEQGWGVLSLVRRHAPRAAEAPVAWVGDIIPTSSGIIPPAAAKLLVQRAVATDWGRAACREHVVGMKAVAGADRAAEGQPLLVLKYEQHLELLAQRRVSEIDWTRVRELLMAYPTARRAGAATLIEAAFGVEPLEDIREGGARPSR